MKGPTCLREQAGASLTVIGLGNIGSQLVALSAFYPRLRRVVLVDRDNYDRANLTSQRISPKDVGLPKPQVQARRLRALNPALEVHAVHEDVAAVPLGLLRSDLIVSCVDSLETRIQINQIAWHLGAIWFDSGVEPLERLARVEGYLPRPGSACFECGLSDEDYRALGSRHPCQQSAPAPTASNSPASLGALAAALVSEELDKVLRGRCQSALLGRQVILGTHPHAQMVSELHRNPRCRFHHETWQMVSIPGLGADLPLGAALDRLAAELGGKVSLAVAGWPFALALRCPGCGSQRPGLHVVGRRPGGRPVCRRCQREMLATALDLLPCLDSSHSRKTLSSPLRRIGIRAGDILEIRTGAGRLIHCEIAAAVERGCENQGRASADDARHQNLSRITFCEDSGIGSKVLERP